MKYCEEYAALLETPPAEGSGVYITTPAMSPDRGWRAVVFKDGKPFGDEIRWPRLYSRSFREEVMDRCRKADIHRKEE